MKHPKDETAEAGNGIELCAVDPSSGAVLAKPAPIWDQPPNPGKRFEIRTPNRGFNETRAGVKFQEGIGFTDDESAAEDCARFGYQITDCGKTKKGASGKEAGNGGSAK